MPRFLRRLWLLTAVLLTAAMSVHAQIRKDEIVDLSQVPQLHETTAERDARMQWFRDAKFGMFIHWGPCTVGDREIGWGRQANRPWDINQHGPRTSDPEYDSYFRRFNPVKFEAEAWVRLAQEAGMKYMVLIAKHHDGFSQFDSKLSDYDIMAGPYGRDIVKQFVEACHRHGMRTGLYYSTRDWYHPDYLVGDNTTYDAWYRGQVEELLSQYGEVDLMWFDHVGGRDWGKWRFDRLFAMMYRLQPGLLVNNRAAAFCGPATPEDRGPATPEIQTMTRGDFDTPEQQIGAMNLRRDWESCMILSPTPQHDGWSYRSTGRTRPLDECIRMLASTASGGGNLLLNLGPDQLGEFRPEEVAIAKGMGAWLGKYGRAIYGTRGGPFTNGKWGGSTHRGNTVYLHGFDWPGDKLALGALPHRVTKAHVLPGGTEVAFVQNSEGFAVTVPSAQRDHPITVIELTLDQPAPSGSSAATNATVPAVLKPDSFRHYVEDFNALDRETVTNRIPNAEAWDWLSRNVPLLECPDKNLEEIYYFRWWTYRKHVKETPDGFIITEFLPSVPWAGKHNSINCPAGHHFYEGRWLHDPRFLDDYAVFWFRKGGEPRKYSFWAADAIYARGLVLGDQRLARELLPDLMANYAAWEQSHLDASGLFWQNDGNDGMEVSVGGSGCRATINSYQYGDAVAIARIAELAGQADLAAAWRTKAAALKRLVQEKLWDSEAQFFKVLPRGTNRLADVRELHGYTPWYFLLPDPDQSVAWKQLMDPQGFYAPFGPTTAEQRHPGFAVAYVGHECQWNGPSWPLATSITLTALANLLNRYSQDVVGKEDFWKTFQCYLRSHRFRQLPPESLGLENSGSATVRGGARLERRETNQPWIDENLNPFNGDWIARTLLQHRRQAPDERGKDYNHSTFNDLVITGVIGLRPRADDVIEVNPLLPEGTWDDFCLDGVRYHGRTLTILFDRTGARYGLGSGLQILVDGQSVARGETLQRLTAKLPAKQTTRVNPRSIENSPFLTELFTDHEPGGATLRRAD